MNPFFQALLALPLLSAASEIASPDSALQSALVQGVFQNNSLAQYDFGSHLAIKRYDHADAKDAYHLVDGDLASFGGGYDAISTLPYIICWATDVAPHVSDGQDAAPLQACGNATIWQSAPKLTRQTALVGASRPDDPKWMPAYNGAALQDIFDRVYLPPKAKRAGVLMQKLYNVSLKIPIANLAEDVAALGSEKGLLDKLSREMIEAYRDWTPSNEKYNPGFLSKKQRTLKKINGRGWDGRELGIILRRHIDGTLPALVGMLRKVLKDYDPKESAKLDSKLAAGNFVHGDMGAPIPSAAAAPAAPAVATPAAAADNGIHPLTGDVNKDCRKIADANYETCIKTAVQEDDFMKCADTRLKESHCEMGK